MTQFFEQNPYEVLFRDFFDTDTLFDGLKSCKYPYPVDIYEADNGLIIDIASIGLTSDDIKITIESDVLRIQYENKKDNDSKKYIHKGIARRSYNLGWKIGAQFDLSKLEAVMDKGLLQISIPYSEKAAPRKVTIVNK